MSNSYNRPPAIVVDEVCVSRPCMPGQQLMIGLDACAAVLWGKDEVELRMPAPQEYFVAPDVPDVISHIVSLRDIRLPMGFRDMLSYRVPGAPDRLFRLGFHGEMTLRVAHIQGFSMVIRRSLTHHAPQVSLLSLLLDWMRPRMMEALTEVLGEEPPDYPEILRQRDALQTAMEKAIFRPLYEDGLCIRPHSLMIQEFSKPMLFVANH